MLFIVANGKKMGTLYYMMENPHPDERQELKELLRKYQNLRSGSNLYYLEEESFERIIDYYDDNEQLNLALEAAECGIRQFPYSPLLLIKKADLLIASQQFSEALQVLDQVSVLDISDMNTYILKIDAWLGLGEDAKALSLFEESVQTFDGPEKIDLLFELADVFDDYGCFEEVFQCLHDILLIDPANEEALYKICFWTDYAKKFEESIDLHKKLIDEHPYNHLAWFNLGTAFQGINLHEKAIDAYLYAIAINEKFDYAYRNLGDAYICIKNYEEAIEALEKVLELSVPEGVIYEALGHCYEKLRQFVQARVNYRKALHMTPANSDIFYKIALSYMAEEKWNNAVDQLNQAIQLVPEKKPLYYFSLGQCLSKTGHFQESVNALLRFIHARQSSIRGWKELVTVLFDYGFYEEALVKCAAAYKSTGGKPIFIYFQAALHFKLGMRKEGLLLLETAIKKSPRNLKEFISLDPAFLQRASIVKIINAHIKRKEKSRKKKK